MNVFIIRTVTTETTDEYGASVRTARRKRTQENKKDLKTIQRVCEMRNWNFVMGA